MITKSPRRTEESGQVTAIGAVTARSAEDS
ncbi:hypothetical protein F4556_003564 [Kitasatospora gansuensis]|uniref:Uncharacterized protein n=1 Tax=Kitasatospora gansuensis TaxID=258050 RepID=A0A7W7WIY2_9ACTN|nr:hypothetical protein [Kitasatospora gansuensis]